MWTIFIVVMIIWGFIGMIHLFCLGPAKTKWGYAYNLFLCGPVIWSFLSIASAVLYIESRTKKDDQEYFKFSGEN